MDFNSSMHPISWFKDRYVDKTLKIKPPYQRKPIWTSKQKCYLIESILMGLPVPEIYIQQTTSPKGDTTYAIVDGQQRTRTVLQFIGSEIDPDEKEHNKFVLDKLKPTSEWYNVSFSDLHDNVKASFYGYKFAVRYLNTGSDDEVRDMFERLNKYLTPLKSQELRNATYMGPFIKLSEDLADNEYWAENRIVTAAAIRRMSDVEFMSELLIGVLHGPQGGSPKVIDEYYYTYEDCEDEFPEQRAAVKLFNETLNTIKAHLPDIKATRWGNKTDFYTLFVTIADLLRNGRFKSSSKSFKSSLDRFAKQIDVRLANEKAKVSKDAIGYVRAVEKGANDKKRRADRHLALMNVIRKHFTAHKKSA